MNVITTIIMATVYVFINSMVGLLIGFTIERIRNDITYDVEHENGEDEDE